VYVDEPELGRVAPGEAVAITWDALPGKHWQGTVERMPDRIEAVGSRQVGEVACAIENPRRELPLGANVNAEIRTAEVADALTIPKEALRRDTSGDYVFVLAAGRLERRPVRTGISNIAVAQVTEGLSGGELVALPADVAIKAGDLVTAVVK
jgi:multidrug efflux pump subunit AcrA (membrane-fusion protein)